MREKKPGIHRAVGMSYLFAFLAVLATFILRMALNPLLGTSFPFLIFIPAIMFAGWFGGSGPGILSVALSFVLIRYYYMAPLRSFAVDGIGNMVSLFIFALVGYLITYLNQRRRAAIALAEKAAESLRANAEILRENAEALRINQVQLQGAYEHEKRIAETLQRSLLMTPAEMKFDGLTVEAFYEPAYDEALIGGDFFDAFALSNNKVALVVGDVSGKGLQAAAHTAEIKYALRAILREHPHPALAMIRLNRVVCESQVLDAHGFGRFITLALAVVDPRTGLGELALAACEPPLLIRRPRGDRPETTDGADTDGSRSADDWEYDLIEGGGLPLAVESTFEYELRRIQMGPTDTLLLLTDGLTEARRKREMLGYDGMANLALEGAQRDTLREMGEAILNGAHEFAGAKLQDDACLLLARRS